MTVDEARRLLAVAFASLPAAAPRDAEIVKHMPRAWATMLSSLTYEQADAALRAHLATSPRWPTFHDLLRHAHAASAPRRAGAEAWGDVLAAIARVGSHRPAPSFADPVVARVVAALGWRELCLSENATADRARFIEAYDKVASARVERQLVAAIAGPQPPALDAGPTTIATAIGKVLRDV